MKKYRSLQALACLGFLAHAAVAVSAPEKVDVSKVNKALGAIVSTVLKEHQSEPDSVFKTLELKLDEKKTILDDDDRLSAGVSVKTAVKKSRWKANGESSLQLDVTLGADRLKKEAEATLGATLETDTLALVRFAAKEIEPDFCKGVKAGTPEEKACGNIRALAGAKDLPAVFDGIAKLSELNVVDMQAKLAVAKTELDAAAPEKKEAAQKKVDRLEKSVKASEFAAKELRAAVTASGQTGVLKISLRDLDLDSFGTLRELEFYVDKNKLEVKASWRMTDIEDIDSYFKMKPELAKHLKNIADGEEESKETVAGFLHFYLRFAGEFIAGTPSK